LALLFPFPLPSLSPPPFITGNLGEIITSMPLGILPLTSGLPVVPPPEGPLPASLYFSCQGVDSRIGERLPEESAGNFSSYPHIYRFLSYLSFSPRCLSLSLFGRWTFSPPCPCPSSPPLASLEAFFEVAVDRPRVDVDPFLPFFA